MVEGLGVVRYEQDWSATNLLWHEVQEDETGHTTVEMIGVTRGASVPEPSTITIASIAAGLAVACVLGRRRTRRSSTARAGDSAC